MTVLVSRSLTWARRLTVFGLVLFLWGCSSARMSDTEADRLFKSGDYSAAADYLKKGLEKETLDGKDGLLYLLDYALALHTAGKFDESARAFIKADGLAEIKDYTNLSTEAATLLTSDNIKQYKAEEFENVLINVYNAMNYALMGKHEDGRVEARRVNRKLNLMITEGKRKYQQNAFARYLSAILWEADKNWNDAYLDYKMARELAPDFPGIGEDLWRMAYRLENTRDLTKWESEYKLTADQKKIQRERASPSRPAEIVVLFQNGLSPIKRPDPGFYSVPKFYPRQNLVSNAEVSIMSGGSVVAQGSTRVLMDIEAVAIKNLDEKWGGIVAKKIAGAVTKEIIGNQIEKSTNNAGLGALFKLVTYASDQADCRSWNLLPKNLQIARFWVNPGTYEVKATAVGDAANIAPKTVAVKKGEKAFVSFRYMP